MPEAPIHRITVGNRPVPKRPTVGQLNARNFVVRSEAVQLPAPVPAVMHVPPSPTRDPRPPPPPPPPAQVVAAMPPDDGQHGAAQTQTQMQLAAQDQVYQPQHQPEAMVVAQPAGPDWGTLLLMFGLLWALDHFSSDDED